MENMSYYDYLVNIVGLAPIFAKECVAPTVDSEIYNQYKESRKEKYRRNKKFEVLGSSSLRNTLAIRNPRRSLDRDL